MAALKVGADLSRVMFSAGPQLESLHTPQCSCCPGKGTLQTMISQWRLQQHIVVMGETQEPPLPSTAWLTVGRWSPCLAHSFWAGIMLFDHCYDPSLLQYMCISLNIDFHKEYNGSFTKWCCLSLSADNTWSSTACFTQDSAQHQWGQSMFICGELHAKPRVSLLVLSLLLPGLLLSLAEEGAGIMQIVGSDTENESKIILAFL